MRQLAIKGHLEFTPVQHADSRGTFMEYFRADVLEAAVGRGLDLRQANCSLSSAGTLRGVHFASVPPGQAKYVTCTTGSFFDVVVDLRSGSPTFGRWEGVVLDTVDRRAVFIAEGLGHAALALEDSSTLLYLCSTAYDPTREHGVDALDPTIGIEWPTTGPGGSPLTRMLSEKDRLAPSLDQARESGLLPTYQSALLQEQSTATRP